MQIYEVEGQDGQIYEVEADSIEEAFSTVDSMAGGGQTAQDLQSGTGVFAEPPLPESEVEPQQSEPQAPSTWSFEGTGMEQGLPESFQDVVGGMYNAPINTAETILAGRDALTGGDSAESFRKSNIPRYESPRGDNLFTGTGEIVGGAAGGLGAGRLIVKGIEKGTSIASQIVKKGIDRYKKITSAVKNILAPEIGGAAAVDPDTEGLLIGENAYIWEGLGSDENGEFSEELLKKRLNLFMDAVAVVGGAEGAGRAIGLSVKGLNQFIFKPLRNLGNPEKMGETVAGNIIDELTTVNRDDTPEILEQKKNNLINLIESGADESISGGGVIDDIEYTRDTMSALEKGTDDELTVARARGLRAGTQGRGGTPELEAATARPSIETRKIFSEAEELAGGPEAATRSREQIQESVQREADVYADEVERLSGEIIDSKETMVDMINNDPTFGSILDDLGRSGAVNIDLSQVSLKTADDIVKKINTASEKMTRRKNDLFAAIDDAPVNVELLNSSIDDAEAFKVIDEDLRAGLGRAGTSFKSLMDFADFQLQDAINAARAKKEYGKANKLRDLKESITKEQLDYLVTSGQQETRDAAQRAMEYFTKEYAPMFRDGRLEQIQQLGYKHRLQPLNRQAGQRQVVTSALEDSSSPEFSGQIIDLLEKEAGAGKLAADYVISRIADDAQKIINETGKLAAEDVTKFANTLDKFVPVFDKVDKNQVARINDFLTKLRNKKFSTEELQGFLGEATKRKEKAEKDLFTKYKEFFSDDIYTPRTSDTTIFKEVFDDPEVLNKLPGLMKGGDPEGLKAAFNKHFKNKIFRSKEGPVGEKLLTEIGDEELEKLFKAGDILYEKQPEVMTAIKAITREAVQMERGRTSRRMPIFDTSEFRKSARGATDFVITQIFGQLNRVGARLRSGAGRVFNKIDPASTMDVMMDKIMADPHEFVRLAKSIQKKNAKKVSQKELAPLYRFFGAEAAYATQTEDSQTEELFDEDRYKFKETERVVETDEEGFLEKLFGKGEPKEYRAGPMSQYPTDEDAEFFEQVQGDYGSGNEPFTEGHHVNFLGREDLGPYAATDLYDPTNMVTKDEHRYIDEGDEGTKQLFQKAQIMANRSAIVGLGFDPRKINLDVKSKGHLTLGGMYDTKDDRIWARLTNSKDADEASTIVHESVHRGIELLKKADRIPLYDGKEPTGEIEELIVRRLMQTKMGDPEQGSIAEKYKNDASSKKIDVYIKDLEKAASEMVAEKRPRGPR